MVGETSDLDIYIIDGIGLSEEEKEQLPTVLKNETFFSVPYGGQPYVFMAFYQKGKDPRSHPLIAKCKRRWVDPREIQIRS